MGGEAGTQIKEEGCQGGGAAPRRVGAEVSPAWFWSQQGRGEEVRGPGGLG